MSKPSVVFADEPTGNLDSHASETILAMLRRVLDDFKQTVVMVTHDPLAAADAHPDPFLRHGLVMREAGRLDPRQILERDEDPAAHLEVIAWQTRCATSRLGAAGQR